MKRSAYILLAAVLVFLSTGCSDWFNTNPVEKRMVLLYIAATETSLSPYADGNIADMLTSYVPAKNSKTEELLVFFQNRNTATSTTRSEAVLTRYYINRRGQIENEVIANFGDGFDACKPESLAQVLATAEEACKPTYRTILFSSHGTGWMPSGYFDGGGESSFGKSQMSRTADSGISELSRLKVRESIGYDAPTKNEIDIRDFAAELGKYHWEAALLDCCYMSTIEGAYEMRDCCDWIIASPTEILITGFPYTVILDQLFNHPGKEGLEFICQKYYELYQSQSGSLQSGTIALINCKELDALASICETIVSGNRAAMTAVPRLEVQHYFYKSNKDYFFDLAHYFEKFSPEDSFSEFSAQLSKAVPYKNTTERFLGVKMEHYSGVSCYIPNPSYPKLNAYYKQLAWNQKVKVIE